MTLSRIRLWTLLALALVLIGSCNSEGLRRVALPAFYKATEPAPEAQAKSKGKPVAPPDNPWKSFAEDMIHDPESPAFDLLQRPSEALLDFPRDVAGNYVDWVKALEQGHISPRTNLYEETDVNVLDLDIYLSINGSLPVVKFPHRPHTLWLDCKNCHDGIFVAKAGANKFTMVDILNGKYCGQCHGAVSFPLTECARCHSVPHDEYRRLVKAGAKKGGGG